MAEPVHDHIAHQHVEDGDGPTVAAGRRGWGWTGVVARVVLTLVGALAMIASAFMDWVEGITGVNLDVRALWQAAFDRQGASFVATVGFVAIVLGLVAIVGLAPRSGWLTRLAGALGIVAFVLFAIQVYRADMIVTDLGPGSWTALGGGVVALAGGFLGTRAVLVAGTPVVEG